MIVIATVIWVYFGRTSTFMESATLGGRFDGDLVDGVKQVVRILPLNAIQVGFWMCQNSNQSIIQQTDVRLGTGSDESQMPGTHRPNIQPYQLHALRPARGESHLPGVHEVRGQTSDRYGKVLAGTAQYVDANGDTQFILNDDCGQAMNDIPWWTAVPQYLLIALAEVLAAVASYDINYSEVPQSRRSTSIALAFFTLLSVLVLLFGKCIPSNLNDGRMKNLFFTLGGIMVLTIGLYVAS
ncbi:hypothetical protein PR003_g1554 [Phytophthora rubi]|uniref:Uncharacterized protein n=1 Tax=Phytophthora rubi TaxID=129364 RepID=A0A6A3L8U7_9STRA|nr:hypothetical protein PR001_g15645 [Phytophthora rubi]KAE9031220.1 hypothetical protein PR002_g9690 [Phytophthora rubi]KAE9357888.1 hypothetical protein PR003_g1554 [Phytophthora rubi]